MAPIEGQQMMATAMPTQMGAGSISLATLIEFMLQRTYHDLSVMSELLPRKNDMERKVEIVQFASRTRQMFVRLLALVKWANSAGKVDRCGLISNFLDQQAMLFVESADIFAKMARETLVHGRLPNFSLPCAIDVLTTGSYPRLPTCIREKIVPPDPITTLEKRTTLQRLSQIIQYRLVTNDLPPQLRKLKIENGRVKFHVDHEFEVTLTVMGDGPSNPWRLLDIDILVEDHETGDGKALVHSMQTHYIHQLIQSRLPDHEKPLQDLYTCLHTFCQSLQLEVLHSQAQRLLSERLTEFVKIEEYTAGKCLVLSYWRDNLKKDHKDKGFRLSVHVDNDASKPLQITHNPTLPEDESARVGQAIRSDHLSIEKLLVQTIGVRGQVKLKDLQKELKSFIQEKCDIAEIPPVMYVPVLPSSVTSEMLRISINMQHGTYLASVSQYPECSIMVDIEDCLNHGKRDISALVSSLRLWLGLKRCEKSVQHLPAYCTYDLPLVNLSGHPLEYIGRHRLFIRVGKQSNSYVIVTAKEDHEDKSLKYSYYFLEVEPAVFRPIEDESIETVPPMFLKAGNLTPLNTYVMTHGPHTRVHDDVDSPEKSLILRKRRLYADNNQEHPMKRMKFSPYFVPDLTHILALLEEQVPFTNLVNELEKKSIPHQGIQVDGEGACLSLTLLELPPLVGCSEAVVKALKKNLLSCKFRLQKKVVCLWIVELIFNNSPIQSTNSKEQGPVHRVYLQYDLTRPETMSKLLQDFQDDLTSIAHLYGAVLEFADVLNIT